MKILIYNLETKKYSRFNDYFDEKEIVSFHVF